MRQTDVENPRSFAGISGFLQRHSGKVIFIMGVLTLLLLIPLFALDSDEEASASPSGEMIDLQDDLDDRFQSIVLGSSYILEARAGASAAKGPSSRRSSSCVASARNSALRPITMSTSPT